MKILFLTQIIPYPPDAGPRIKTWHVLQYLANSGHDITLLSFVRKDEEKHLSKLSEVCQQIIPIPIKRTRIEEVRALLRSQIKRTPFLIERDFRPLMAKTTRELLTTHHYDAIHVDQVNMAQFISKSFLNSKRIKTIFDAHNATWVILDRMRHKIPLALRPFLSLEVHRMKAYENRLVEEFDHVITVTEIDKNLILKGRNGQHNNSKVHVIPIAVNTDLLRPVKRKPDSNHIVTVASLNYPPNADGVRWFLREVFPIIKRQKPEVTLTVIGKNPPKDFFDLAKDFHNEVQITGYVEDLIPYLENSAFMVVPVLAGGGMRVRILEAFSRGIPVVTTTIGLEGISATDGIEVLVEDTPENFAQAVIRLLHDFQLQEQLAINARNLVTSKYDWKISLQELETIYKN